MVSSPFVLLVIFSGDIGMVADGSETRGVTILYDTMAAAYLTAETWLGCSVCSHSWLGPSWGGDCGGARRLEPRPWRLTSQHSCHELIGTYFVPSKFVLARPARYHVQCGLRVSIYVGRSQSPNATPSRASAGVNSWLAGLLRTSPAGTGLLNHECNSAESALPQHRARRMTLGTGTRQQHSRACNVTYVRS
jgi:hypothetical protein